MTELNGDGKQKAHTAALSSQVANFGGSLITMFPRMELTTFPRRLIKKKREKQAKTETAETHSQKESDFCTTSALMIIDPKSRRFQTNKTVTFVTWDIELCILSKCQFWREVTTSPTSTSVSELRTILIWQKKEKPLKYGLTVFKLSWYDFTDVSIQKNITNESRKHNDKLVD